MKCDKYDKCTKTDCSMCPDYKLYGNYTDLIVFDDQPKRQLKDPDCHNE